MKRNRRCISNRNTYLQPFLKQSHIDPIRGQNSKQIFNNMIRHHQVCSLMHDERTLSIATICVLNRMNCVNHRPVAVELLRQVFDRVLPSISIDLLRLNTLYATWAVRSVARSLILFLLDESFFSKPPTIHRCIREHLSLP